MAQRVLDIAVAFGTVLLAVVTAWLAFDTHRLAASTTEDERLRQSVIIFRECATASRTDAKAGDSLIDLRPNIPDKYESEDRLSTDEFPDYLTSSKIDYLRCEIINAGQLPVLDVQMALDAESNHKTFRIVSSVFHILYAGDRRVIWFSNTTSSAVTVHSPNKVRYTPYVSGSEGDGLLAVADLRPVLADRWTIRKNRDVAEDLDQREMQTF